MADRRPWRRCDCSLLVPRRNPWLPGDPSFSDRREPVDGFLGDLISGDDNRFSPATLFGPIIAAIIASSSHEQSFAVAECGQNLVAA